MLGAVTPVLRSFYEALAKAFYVDFLGFEVVFAHRFEAGLPLYMAVRRDGCVLHRSEHHGDATPGSAVRIAVDDVAAYAAQLRARGFGSARPGEPHSTPWGTCEVTITDPAGNRLTFVSPGRPG